MILGVGTDIVEVNRFHEKLENSKFLDTIFTEKELKYCMSKSRPAEHLASRFAAKEAYMKALGTGWSSTADFCDIEVVNLESGQPTIKLHGLTKEAFEKSDAAFISLSMSHTANQAISFVVIS